MCDENKVILSETNWSKELAGYGLPDNLTQILTVLLACRERRYFHPCAVEDIEFAKEFLKDGITVGAREFSLVVFEPLGDEEGMTLFFLLPKWPNGKIKFLSEL